MLNLTLSKEEATVEPVDILTQEGPTITKFYVFRSKDKNKSIHPWLNTREFSAVEAHRGFFKCTYKNIAGEKETAYVTYFGQPITNKKMVSAIDAYMKECDKHLNEPYEIYYQSVSKELDNLKNVLNNIINENIDTQKKNNL